MDGIRHDLKHVQNGRSRQPDDRGRIERRPFKIIQIDRRDEIGGRVGYGG